MTRRGFLLWLAAVLGIGLLLFCYRYLGALAEGESVDFRRPLVNEMTGSLGAGLLFFGVRALTRRFPLNAPAGWHHTPIYLICLALFAGCHTSFMWGSRSLLYLLFGLGDFDYGRMPLRYAMELPIQAIIFTLMVATLHAAAAFREAREREVRAAQLSASLARAQLASLAGKLQPHFLFNALNAISATMYEDPAAADEMLEQLSELLRASLQRADLETVPLAEDAALLERYLAIMRARFGTGLEAEVHLGPGTEAARVPPFLLQPLVENAIRHGSLERSGRGKIRVRAEQLPEGVEITVEDDGPSGTAAEPASSAGLGLGLKATAERLALLYGEEHRLEAGPGPGGGFRVRIRLPVRGAAEVEP
ncbi:MAG TPA: histidine kinase [Thermoanaerobaculia bacterium]|nr:histidine kinase [Thermoanaerobaculia bacterium]